MTDIAKAVVLLENLPAILLKTRQALGLSLREVGDQVPCSHTALWRFETGRGHLDTPRLILLMRWLSAHTEERR